MENEELDKIAERIIAIAERQCIHISAYFSGSCWNAHGGDAQGFGETELLAKMDCALNFLEINNDDDDEDMDSDMAQMLIGDIFNNPKMLRIYRLAGDRYWKETGELWRMADGYSQKAMMERIMRSEEA